MLKAVKADFISGTVAMGDKRLQFRPRLRSKESTGKRRFTVKEQGQGLGTVDGKFPRGANRSKGDSDLTGLLFFLFQNIFLKLIYLFLIGG